MVVDGINFPEDQLRALCDLHGVKRLSLFGSVLRGDSNPGSDVDLLVEFHPGKTPGMLGFGQMILDFEKLLGRRVDLRTLNDLSPYFAPAVAKAARTLHAA
ncbi:MAG: nucleotidyltransferase family protein [Phycisphaerales bacterium]|nr:nucleotidyltransferase family protein [Phycisphaerales bacterium]